MSLYLYFILKWLLPNALQEEFQHSNGTNILNTAVFQGATYLVVPIGRVAEQQKQHVKTSRYLHFLSTNPIFNNILQQFPTYNTPALDFFCCICYKFYAWADTFEGQLF